MLTDIASPYLPHNSEQIPEGVSLTELNLARGRFVMECTYQNRSAYVMQFLDRLEGVIT